MSRRELITFGEVDPVSLQQLERCLDASGESSRGVLCADHHKGYSMPIGGVVASDRVVMPAGVGYDIGCGNCAVQTPIRAADLDVSKVMDEIWRTISFGMGQKNDERIPDHPVFDAIAHSPVQRAAQTTRERARATRHGRRRQSLRRSVRGSRGRSLGSACTSARAGLGHKTASGFLSLASGRKWDQRPNDSMDAKPATIPLGTPLADDYLAAMNIAGEYAYAGRDWVVDRVLRMLQTEARATRAQPPQLRVVGKARRQARCS